MPRPDKRFVRYPRQGASKEPEAEESKAAQTRAPSSSVKGRHMVVPRPSAAPTVDARMPTATPRHPVPGEQSSKYDLRPTSGAAPPREPVEQPAGEPVPATPAPMEPAAKASEKPTEVVFDLREDEDGFEATYWKRAADEPIAEGDQR